MSYLSRHRPICSVIEDIRIRAEYLGDQAIIELCKEAKDYAERMSAKLVEYKKERE